MKDQYFYQDRGKTIGPIDFDDVRERIKDGRLKLFDLVYRDGEEAWRMALEHSALRSEFKTTTLASMKERPWVCLQRKSATELEFHTTGPYTQEEIHDSLLAGRMSYSDYAWKDGFQDWKRIGSLEEFNPRVRTPASSSMQPTPEPPAKELLQNVVELKRPKLPIPEAPPKEAKGPDLTKSEAPPPVPAPSGSSKTKKAGPPPAASPPPVKSLNERLAQAKPMDPDATVISRRPAPAAEAESPELIGAPPERRKKRRTRMAVDWGLVGVLVLLLAGLVVIVSRFAMPKSNPTLGTNISPALETAPPEGSVTASQPAPVNESEPLAGPPAPDAAADEAAAPSNTSSDSGMEEPAELPPPPKPTSRPPKELFLAVQTISSNQARIEIRTDGSADFPVYVQVVGLPGQVSEGGAFYRFIKYTPSGNPRQPLDLSALKLPQGKFILRAETGTLKRETRLTMGANDPAYKQAVARQRKMWAHAIWRERLTLFHLSQTLERALAQGLVPTKKFNAKGFDALAGVKRPNGAKYFLFEEWWELHQVVKDAKTSVTPQLLARAQKVRDRLATYSVWK